MTQARSNFVTPAGLIVLAAMALLSAYLGIGALFALLFGLFLVCLVSFLWTRHSLSKLDITLPDCEVCGFPGDTVSAAIKVKNSKMLPVVWLKAAFPLGKDACVSPAEEPAVFSWVMPHQEIVWNDAYTALRRGVSAVPAAELFSGDGFGLSDASKAAVLIQPLRFVVYPALIDIDVSFMLRKLTELESSSSGLYTDPTLLKSVRELTPSDSMRDINWRLLAREGKLLANVKEKLEAKRICFVLDLRSYSYEEQVDSPGGSRTVFHADKHLERTLSVVASAVCALSEKGVICSLAVPGYTVKAWEDKPEEIRSSSVVRCDEASDPSPVLTALAEIEYDGGPAGLPLEEMSAESHLLGQVFCFSLSAGNAAYSIEKAVGSSVWTVAANGAASERCIMETELLL